MTETLKYDVIVVGSGLGGLMSAVILAKEGYKVCVLEKNNQFGGNLQTFSRDKKIFDTGVHYIGGLDKGQNLYRYFSYAGIMKDLKLEKMPTVVDEIQFGQHGVKYPIAQGYDTFVEYLAQFFPQERDVLQQYIVDIQSACCSFPLYQVSEEGEYSPELLQRNLKNYLDTLTDNTLLKAVLMGNNFLYAAEGEQTPFYVHALTVNSYITSAYRCVRGGSQISKLLVKRLRELGGEAFRHRDVKGYELQNGRINAVSTTEGERYEAHVFISNIDPARTLQQVGKEHFRSVFYERVTKLSVTVSSFSGYFVLKTCKIRYQASNMFYHQDENSVWSSSDYQPNEWPRTLMVSMTADKEHPEFADTLSVLTYMRFDEVKEWEDSVNTIVHKSNRSVGYQKFKEEKLQIMLDRLDEIIPGTKAAVSTCYASTPLSYRDYIGGREGSLYGTAKQASDPLRTMLSPKTKIPNLYLTGQNVGMHGLLGVTIGAVATCGEIVGASYLIHKIHEETKD